jgi:photosystem II stability/assembly factor-like uncharacterized protein
MVSSTEGWAVGGGVSQSNATIIHYTGGTWTALPSNLIPVSPVNGFSLNSVFFKNAADGWAVGSSGVIVHFDGANWGGITSPTYDNFTSISFGPPLTGPVDPNDGWAVGNASIADSLEPTVFHWNGFMWTKGVVIGARNNLNSVYMLNGGDVWAVGGGAQPTASCTASPTKLCPVILHFNGGTWNTVTPPAGAYSLKSVFMVSSNEGWAVGETAGTGSPYGAGAAGIILHYTVSGGVGTWAIFPAPSSPFLPSGLVPPLNSVFMLGQNEGWAVGDNATILHYTVTGGIGTWNLVTVSGTPTLSPSANLTSIFMLSPSAGWAVGGIQATGSYSAGPVIIYWDGFKWTPAATPTIPGGITPTGHTSALLKSVFCTDANNCYAVGYPGKLFATILHWDGFAWTHITTTPALLGKIPPILTSVYLINGSGGWIVGSDPDFDTDPNFMLPSFGLRTALSTILRCVPQFITTTLTTTVVSTICTVCSATTAAQVVTTTVTTISTFSTNTTVVPPPTPPLIWIIPLLAAVLAGLLLLILFLLLRRKPKPPAVCYPVQRRPC